MSDPEKPARVPCSFLYKNDGHACGEDAYALGLCTKHYMQKRRKRLGKTQEIAAAGEGDQITFKCNRTLKGQAEVNARKAKLSVGAYLRLLIEKDSE